MENNKSIDLTKLKDEIHTRKQNKGNTPDESGNAPKDNFLNNLVESLNTGRQTEATDKLKKVDAIASEKSGDKMPASNNSGTVASETSKYSQQQQPQSNSYNPPAPTNGNERDEKLYEEFERRKKEMLGGGAASTPQASQQPTAPQQRQSGSQFVNEDKLYETVNNVISEKFAVVVEQAMKDSIVEIYSAARMKEVLEENRDTIKKMVIETIRELQSKKKQ